MSTGFSVPAQQQQKDSIQAAPTPVSMVGAVTTPTSLSPGQVHSTPSTATMAAPLPGGAAGVCGLLPPPANGWYSSTGHSHIDTLIWL